MCRLLIVLGLCYFINRKGFLQYNGFYPTITIRNLQLIFVPAALILLIAFSNFNTYKRAGYPILVLFGLNAALTSALEELAIRGTVLALLLKHYANSSRPFFKAILLSSLLFAVAHFINLVRSPGNISGVVSQVIFAVGIGFFLAVLLFRTGNITVPIFVHFLINFAGGAYRLKEQRGNEMVITENSDIGQYMFIAGISILLIVIGMYMLRRINREEWLYKTSSITLW